MKNTINSSRMVKFALVLVGLAVAVVVNMIAIEAVSKFSLKVDLTDNKLYELSALTYEVASGLEEPVVITVFSSELDYPVMIKEILARYDGLSDKIVVKYKDPYENPVLVDSFRQKGYSITENDILVNGMSKLKQLKIDDLYIFNAAKTEVKALKAEQAITSAILYTNSETTLNVKFTDGHGERPSTGLMRVFLENNFDLKRVALDVVGIAEDTDLLVIATPERDFQDVEVGMIGDYLERGGKLLVFIEPAEKELPHLEGLLAKWGIELGSEVVFESKAYLSNNPINIVPMYAPHPINSYFADKRLFLVSPATRALQKSSWNEYELDVMPVLTSSPESYGKVGKEFDSTVQEDGDVKGPFILAMSSERKVEYNDDEHEAKVLVVGSKNFYGDDVLGRSSYANSDFLVQSINWLIEKDSSISIPTKNIQPDPINILPDTVWMIGIIFIGIIPILIIVIGVVVCIRRKRL